MITASRYFFSEPLGTYRYWYLQIPFMAEERREVHIIDHVLSRRLNDLPFVTNARCETESGLDVLSIEIEFESPIDQQIIDSVYEQLFIKPLTIEEVDREKGTTQIEVMQEFLRKDIIYPHLLDYRCTDIDELITGYKGISSIHIDEVERVRKTLQNTHKILIASVSDKDEEAEYMLKRFSVEEPSLHGSPKEFELPSVLEWQLDNADMVYVKEVFRVWIADALEYEKTVLVFGVYHDVIADKLLSAGMSYDVNLLIVPTTSGAVDFIFTYRTLPHHLEESKFMLRSLLAESIIRLDPNARYLSKTARDTRSFLQRWIDNPIEHDYNRVWQLCVFGEENYKAPELIDSVLTSSTLKSLGTYAVKLNITQPKTVLHIGEHLQN